MLAIHQHLNKPLAAEIIRRAAIDQRARLLLFGTPPSNPHWMAYEKEVEHIDKDNTSRMKQIVNRYGWPGKSLLGAKGADDAWLLIQHADKDRPFQRECFAFVLSALDDGDISRPNAAMFIDRVLTGEGKPQLYGSQWAYEAGKLKPMPIMDPATVDQRRAAMHLMPLKEYQKMLEDMYKAQLGKKSK